MSRYARLRYPLLGLGAVSVSAVISLWVLPLERWLPLTPYLLLARLIPLLLLGGLGVLVLMSPRDHQAWLWSIAGPLMFFGVALTVVFVMVLPFQYT